MAADFERAIAIILAHETRPGSTDGSFTNIPEDDGGPTKWGITAGALGAYRALGRDATIDEVKALTKAEAEEIYRAAYWTRFHCDQLEDQVVATKVFDMAVNLTPHAVGELLQRAVNRCQAEVLVVDGVAGSKTIAAANRCNPQELVTELVHLQTEHYLAICQRNPKDEKFKKGWVDRARWPYEAV